MPNLEKFRDRTEIQSLSHDALCSNASALLTGYNHQQQRRIDHGNRDCVPGHNGVRPQSITLMAEVLRQNGSARRPLVSRNATVGDPAAAHTIVGRRTQASRSLIYSSAVKRTSAAHDGTTQVELPEDPKYHHHRPHQSGNL
jgi:arylsulfatase